MAKKTKSGVHALFKFAGDEGTTWLFVLEGVGTWAITRDGERVESGAADRAGIGAGVEKFLLLTGAGMRKHQVAATAAP